VVSPNVAGDVAGWPDQAQRAAVGAGIQEQAQQLLDQHGPRAELHVLVALGQPREVLTDLSGDAELLVVGSHGRGPLGSKLLGSVGVAVVREARCPVVVVRPHERARVRHGVLAAVDVDDASALVVAEFAIHEASLLRLPLTVVHAVPDDCSHVIVDNARRQVSELLAGLREKYPDVECTPVVQRGSTEEVVLAESEGRHLTVIGNPRRHRKHGTTAASRIVERATEPVAVVPSGPAPDESTS
jgi:nucleotide-binding universal stress UspA family protein